MDIKAVNIGIKQYFERKYGRFNCILPAVDEHRRDVQEAHNEGFTEPGDTAGQTESKAQRDCKRLYPLR